MNATVKPSVRRGTSSRGGFTLMELLMVLLIITIIAALSLSALAGATEMAREQRTRAIVMKIDLLIQEQFESYRTRQVPIKIPPLMDRQTDMSGTQYRAPTHPAIAARIRLYAMRDLMRMEMPDRVTDVVDGPAVLYTSPWSDVVSLGSRPALQNTYRRLATRAAGANWATNWTQQWQGSECLYLILSTKHDGDKSAIDYFSPSEIGDTDDDGMKEILDAWGTPIEFLRWAPGYAEQPGLDGGWGVAGQDDNGINGADDVQEAGWSGSDDFSPLTTQTRHYEVAPDPFDPVKVDPRWAISTAPLKPYALRPLIFSAGRDKVHDVPAILTNDDGTQFRYSTTTPPNDPYYIPSTASGQVALGTIGDRNSDGYESWGDNITNHYVQTQ